MQLSMVLSQTYAVVCVINHHLTEPAHTGKMRPMKCNGVMPSPIMQANMPQCVPNVLVVPILPCPGCVSALHMQCQNTHVDGWGAG